MEIRTVFQLIVKRLSGGTYSGAGSGLATGSVAGATTASFGMAGVGRSVLGLRLGLLTTVVASSLAGVRRVIGTGVSLSGLVGSTDTAAHIVLYLG